MCYFYQSLATEMREKESLKCGRMHIWALKTKMSSTLKEATNHCHIHACFDVALWHQYFTLKIILGYASRVGLILIVLLILIDLHAQLFIQRYMSSKEIWMRRALMEFLKPTIVIFSVNPFSTVLSVYSLRTQRVWSGTYFEKEKRVHNFHRA